MERAARFIISSKLGKRESVMLGRKGCENVCSYWIQDLRAMKSEELLEQKWRNKAVFFKAAIKDWDACNEDISRWYGYWK